MIDISKAFGTPAEPIGDFFQRPGVGYYIPLYQREYSWTKENIDQLMEDVICGVDALLSNDDAIHFMGTVILVKENNPTDNIRPIDRRALPSTINNVIDGQQRISSIALLACILYQLIYNIQIKLPKSEEKFDELREEAENKLATLKEMFSVDIRRGNPKRKPIIVRGSVDGWTFDGPDKLNYRSEVSSFLAAFSRAVEEVDPVFPAKPDSSTLVGKNISRMMFYLSKIQKAHQLDDSIIAFPPAWKILESIDEKHIWSYP
ncbi:MAG: DUF262 domain-containing protein, partial [Chlorobium sp.]|nr:DUF262 domain-containing protein [Chlorobium sp.]